MSGEGQQQSDNLSAAGFSTDEVAAWQAGKRQELSGAGFNDQEVNDYFGQKTFNDKPLEQHFDQVIGDAAKAAQGDGTAPAKPFTMSDAIAAGWQNSTSGLMKRQQLPDITMPEDSTWYQRLAFNTTSLAGDVPAMVGGFLVGAGGGAPTGPGAAITGMGGAFALPAALRATMMDAYGKGEFHSASDFISRASGIMLDAGKNWVVGATTAGAGIAAKPVAASIGLTGRAATAAVTSAEIGTMVTTAKAMEGQLPEPKDFLDAALTLAAFKTVPFLAGKVQEGIDTVKEHAPAVADTLRTIYAQTGKMPAEVVKDAGQDPTVMQDVLGRPGEVPTAYKGEVDPYFAPKEPAAPAEVTPPEAGTLEAAQKNILDKIQVGGKDAKPAVNFDTFYTKVVDDMNPLKLAVDAMFESQKGSGGGTTKHELNRTVADLAAIPRATMDTLPNADNPYVLARLTRGSFGKADQFLTQSPYEFKTYKNVGKSLKDIIEPWKDNLDELRAFAVAKRAQELESRGIKSGFDITDANKVVNEAGDNMRPALEQAVKDLTDYQDNLTKYLRDSGVLSKEAYDAMRQANKNYVPFYRVFDNEGLTSGGNAGKGIGTKNPIKAIKGSDRAVIDPIESIIKNTYTYIALADRNEVAQKFVALANKTEDPTQFIEKVKTPIKGITVQEKEMTKFLQDNGIDEVPEDLLTVFRAARQPLEADQIAVFTKGKRDVYSIDPEVAAVFKAADRESANWLFRIIAAPSKMFRAGVTLSPDFFPRNLIRDQFDALINSRSGFIPLLDTVRGAASMIKQDDAFQNWLKSGGANATMVTLDRDYIQNNVIKLNEETGFADHAWNLVKSPFDALRVVSELAENATRLGEFKKAMGGDTSKASIQNAGFQSREVTLDFARIGSKMQATNMLIAFWNAQVQGIDRLARVIKENPVGTAAKIGAAITLPSVLLWWNNHDDPRYADIPDWQKDMFWIVMTKDHIYRIPKPHEAGIVFGSGIERFLDWMKADNAKSVEHYTADVLQSFAPGFVPTVAQPIIEQFANKSLFTGGAIIPASTESLLPEVQYQPYTTELAKALGKMIGTLPPLNKPGSIASASMIENYIRSWSGGLGMYTVQIADAGLRKAGVLPDPVLPTATLADMPFIKAFVVRYPSAGAQPIQDFYDNYDSHKRVLDTVNYLAKQGDFNSAMRLAQTNPQAMIKMGGIKEGLSNAQKLIQLVTKNPNMSADDKRQLIDSTYYQMINMAKSGNELMRQLDQTMAK